MQIVALVGEIGIRNIQLGFVWLGLLMIVGVVIGIVIDSNAEYEANSSGSKGTLGSTREFIRSAHVHGALFSLINIVYGLLIRGADVSRSVSNWGSWLLIVGAVLLPLGLAGRGFMSKSPIFTALVSISSIALIIGIGIIGYGYTRL